MLTVTCDSANKYSVVRCDFADLSELLTGANIHEANREHFKRSILDRWNGVETGGMPASWYGGITSLDAARELLDAGWQDGANKAAGMTPTLSNLVPPVHNTRRRLKWSDNGCELSVDRALTGQWDVAYRSTTYRPTNTPRVISIACAFGANAGISHEEMFWNAAQMIVTADLLENAGYAVELRAIENTRCMSEAASGKHILIDVVVKRAEQPLRPDAIAAVFGHAGVYRTYGFAISLTSPFDTGWSLGSVAPIQEYLERAIAAGLTDATDYILPHAYSQSEAAQNITTALTQLTGQTSND